MTVSEKFEQTFTRRPNSFVPAHTLERLLFLTEKPDRERLALNSAMHWGQGIAFGAVRTLMAERGIRGPFGSFIFMNLRLLNDQSLENATRVGSLPWTWPVNEQVIDLLHKAVYAFVTGAVADRLVPSDGPNDSATSHPSLTDGATPGLAPHDAASPNSNHGRRSNSAVRCLWGAQGLHASTSRVTKRSRRAVPPAPSRV